MEKWTYRDASSEELTLDVAFRNSTLMASGLK